MSGVAPAGRTIQWAAAYLALNFVISAGYCFAATSAELKSAKWWLDSAVQYAKGIEEDRARNDFYSRLASAQTWADDMNGASASAASILNPYQSVMAHCFVASRYHKHGDLQKCREALDEARKVATATDKAKSNNFLYSHLVEGVREFTVCQ